MREEESAERPRARGTGEKSENREGRVNDLSTGCRGVHSPKINQQTMHKQIRRSSEKTWSFGKGRGGSNKPGEDHQGPSIQNVGVFRRGTSENYKTDKQIKNTKGASHLRRKKRLFLRKKK